MFLLGFLKSKLMKCLLCYEINEVETKNFDDNSGLRTDFKNLDRKLKV
jgi:hypothetical protein